MKKKIKLAPLYMIINREGLAGIELDDEDKNIQCVYLTDFKDIPREHFKDFDGEIEVKEVKGGYEDWRTGYVYKKEWVQSTGLKGGVRFVLITDKTRFMGLIGTDRLYMSYGGRIVPATLTIKDSFEEINAHWRNETIDFLEKHEYKKKLEGE